MNTQYHKDYYNAHRESLTEKQNLYYYTNILRIPPEYIAVYKKHKKMLKLLAHADDIDTNAMEFFKHYFKPK
jgi:hypothetical protein